MANYVALGWKRDLIHIVGCCWAAQVGSLANEEWKVAIEKFISVMIQRKKEWTDVKELMPLNFMPYVAKLFKEVTHKDLRGLGQFTGWIGLGSYYHWRVAQQGLIHSVPHLQDEPMLRTPKSHPSGRSLPPRWAPTPATGASAQSTPQGDGQRPALNQRGGQRSASSQGGSSSTSNQGGSSSTPSQGGRSTAPSQGGRPSAPHQSGGPASMSRGATPTTSGGPTDQPSG